jgi:site-specific DNA recombinase
MEARIRAAIYCRLSRKGGRSVDRQEEDGRQIAKQRGWDVVAVYREWGSASPFAKKAREEWDRLLAAVERGEFDAIILWMEDRSARDVTAAGEFVQACKKAGLENVVLPSYDYDLSDPEDVARFYGEVLAGQREAAKMSKRTRRARLQEAELGWPHPGGKRAFGEPGGRRVRDPDKDDDDPEKWLRDEQGRWLRAAGVPSEQVEQEREMVQEAARRVVVGDSLRAIRADWNRRELPGAKGGQWTTRSIRRMLTSPRMIGQREHNGMLYPSDGEIDPILDVPTFEAVRAILADPSRKTTAATVGRPAVHLLSGLAICGICKAKLRADRDQDGEIVYRCPPRSDGGRSCVTRRAEPVERLILRAVFKAVENQEWNRQAADRPKGDPSRPHYEALARITADLDTLDGMLAEAELAERQGRKPSPSSATLRRKVAEREAERERHQAAVNRLQHGRVAGEVPRNLRAVWPDLTRDRQRAIMAALFEYVEILPQGRGKNFDPDAVKVKPRQWA